MRIKQTEVPRVQTPIWRRLTALVSLGSLVVVLGFAIAALLGASALIALFILERAAG
ncbi:MAG: hypothetical protein R2706_15240 [Acidimicrobiales bacterium]